MKQDKESHWQLGTRKSYPDRGLRIRCGPSKPTVGILGRPGWELLPRSRFSSFWSLVLSSYSVESSSYHGFYICPPIPISTEKKILSKSIFSQHPHSNESVLLGSPYPFILITVAKGWDTNPPLWSGILTADSSETCGPGDRGRDKASPSKIEKDWAGKVCKHHLINKTSYISVSQFSRSVMSNSWLPCPSPTLGTCSNSCPSNWWYHPAISSSVVPFSWEELHFFFFFFLIIIFF